MTRLLLPALIFCSSLCSAQSEWTIEGQAIPGFGFNPNVDGLFSFTGSASFRLVGGWQTSRSEYLNAGFGLSFYRYPVGYEKAPVGTQSLSYVDVPVIYRLLINGRGRQGYAFVDIGINTGFLYRAEWVAEQYLSYPVTQHPTIDGPNRADYNAVAVRPIVGLGGVLGIESNVRIVLGTQLSSSFINQSRHGVEQTYPVKASLGMWSANFGIQVRVGSWFLL